MARYSVVSSITTARLKRLIARALIFRPIDAIDNCPDLTIQFTSRWMHITAFNSSIKAFKASIALALRKCC